MTRKDFCGNDSNTSDRSPEYVKDRPFNTHLLTWLQFAPSVKAVQEEKNTYSSRFSGTWRHQYYLKLNLFMLSFVLKLSHH